MISHHILNMSALDVDLSAFAANPPDVMIIDPPYSKHVHKSAVSQSVGGGSRERDLGFEHLTPALRRRIARFAALTKRWSLIYTDLESMAWWRISLEAAGATYIRSIPWIRWSMPQLSGDRPPTGCEAVIVAYGSAKGRKHWRGPGNLLALRHEGVEVDVAAADVAAADVAAEIGALTLEHTCMRGEDKHKAQKSLDQLLDLVTWFSDEGEIVFDPTAGSCTTGLAAKILLRSFVGFEIKPEWVAHGKLRLASWGAGGVAGLSKGDAVRYARFLETQTREKADMARLAETTAKMRAKGEAKRAADKAAAADGAAVRGELGVLTDAIVTTRREATTP